MFRAPVVVSNCARSLLLPVAASKLGVVTRLFQYALLAATVSLVGCRLPSETKYTYAPLAIADPASNVFPASSPTAAAASPAPPADRKQPMITVSPTNVLSGRVVVADPHDRFVVLNYPIGHLPRKDQLLYLYRHGVKVGEAKATGPQRDDNIVADTLRGAPRIGDEVRNP
jgi:hypothetical protein